MPLDTTNAIGKFISNPTGKNGLQYKYGNQALIFKKWGKNKEAEELLKKQEEIRKQIK
jgi:hypothetical protein